jgi:UDP-glucose:glycoprotein glucosyltransferase
MLSISQKEPKLSRARKIPEWEEYDQEIARFSRQLAKKGLIRSRLATADTNVLANEKPIVESNTTSTTIVAEKTEKVESEHQRDEL